MGQTITVRLPKDLADWLASTAAKTGVPQGRIVREQLEKARASHANRSYLSLAGTVRGAKDLSRRRGFARP